MNEPNTREVFREAMNLLTGDGPEDDAVKAYDLFNSLSPDQLELISGAVKTLLAAVEMTRLHKIKRLARRN